MTQAVLQFAGREDLDTIRTLFREYAGSLGIDLCFQNFEQELADLPGRYAPPAGCLLLAQVGNTAAGCIALRPLASDVCEMKRLYIRPTHRAMGLGRALSERFIHEAQSRGYARMRLDTIPSLMAGTVSLYRSLGFTPIPPYRDNPVPGALFMERPISPRS